MAVASLVCPHCEKPVEVQVSGVTRSRACPACGEMLMLQVAEKKGKKTKRRALLMGTAVPEVPTTSTINLPQAKVEEIKPAPAPKGESEASGQPATAKIVESGPPPPPAAKTQRSIAFQSATAPRDEPETGNKRDSATSAQPGEDHVPTTGSLPRPMVLEPSVEPRVLGGDAFDRMRMDPEVKEFRRRFITGTTIVASIVIVLIVIHFITGNNTPETPQSSTKPPDQAAVLEPEEAGPPPVPDGSLVFKAPGTSDFQRIEMSTTPSIVSSNQLSLDASLSVEVLRKFLAASTWKERMGWARSTPGLEDRMKAFYATHADGATPVDNIVESRSTQKGFFEHTVIFEGGGRRLAYVEKTPNGPRVDWASFVGAGDMDWSEFLKQRPITPALMRVIVSEGFFYENQFGSPRLLKCLELRPISEPGAPMIHGYIERSSELTRRIEFWLKESQGNPVALILRLKYPADSRSDKPTKSPQKS
jgi:hypothetical protein